MFSIRDEADQLIESQDISSLLSQYDSATGDLSTVPVGTAPGSLPNDGKVIEDARSYK